MAEDLIAGQFDGIIASFKEAGIKLHEPLAVERFDAFLDELLNDTEVARQADQILRSFTSYGNLLEFVRLRCVERNWPVSLVHVIDLTFAIAEIYSVQPLVREPGYKAPRYADIKTDPLVRKFGLEALPAHVKSSVLPDVSSDAAIMREANRASLPPGDRTELCLLICKHCEAANYSIRLIDVSNMAMALVRQCTIVRDNALQDLKADPAVIDEATKVSQTNCPKAELLALVREICAYKQHAITPDDVKHLAEVLVMGYSRRTPGVIVLMPPESMP